MSLSKEYLRITIPKRTPYLRTEWELKHGRTAFTNLSALSFDGNTPENWRRFKQQYQIYLTALGSEKKDDSIKIAILLKFAGEDAIEVFNTFQFPEGDENNKITLADI